MIKKFILIIVGFVLVVGCMSKEEIAAARMREAKKALNNLTLEENLYCAQFLQVSSASLDFKTRGLSLESTKVEYANSKIYATYPFIDKFTDHVYKSDYSALNLSKADMNNLMYDSIELCLAEIKKNPTLAKDHGKKLGITR